MNDPSVSIRLDDAHQAYRPGATVSGEYRVESLLSDEVKAIEVSVLWYTEGKGGRGSGRPRFSAFVAG